MLYLLNANNYMFFIDPSAPVDVDYLEANGCELFETNEMLYKKAADVQD